jgi:hypothetical protein
MKKLIFASTTLILILLLSTSAFSGEPQISSDEEDLKIAKGIGDLFERLVISRHGKTGPGVQRAVFLKPHGCAKAQFTVSPNLPVEYQVGFFKTPQIYNAWVRLSSDNIPSSPDSSNNTIGFSLKVLNVPGKKVLAGEEDSTSQDFLLQNHHVFFVDTAKDFLEFVQSAFAGTSKKYLKDHPKTAQILNDMEKPVENVLGSNYWSVTPYKFGSREAKYKVVPCSLPPQEPATLADNYLRERLERDLQAQGACFDLQVQLRKKEMPLDQATVEWSEVESVPVTVGRIEIGAQDIKQYDQSCEHMSFTGWHTTVEHEPLGSVNRARGIVYKRLADMRRTRNGVPLKEPTK